VPGKKVLAGTLQEIPCIEVDESESPIQGPKKQEGWYWGKKKRPTIKRQVIIKGKTRKIIDVRQGA
jgi:hypothetical protein